MAECEIERELTVVLRMSPAEADLLKGMLQNPGSDDPGLKAQASHLFDLLPWIQDCE